eukprot:GSChrysophyteH1.ASY1.ANO1.2387.1 assembled CDS
MLVIGITGGIASGKSSVCEFLSSLDCDSLGMEIVVINADKLGHKAYEVGTPCYDSIVSHFGRGIIGEDNRINRMVLGGIVFAENTQMRALEGIVWPVIRSFIQKDLLDLKNSENPRKPFVVIVEAAVMLEAGWQDLVDVLWVTHIDQAVARERLMVRNNLSAEEADKRIGSQMSNSERLSKLQFDRGDIDLDNSGSAEALRVLVNEKFHETLSRSNPMFRFISPLMRKARAKSLEDCPLPTGTGGAIETTEDPK